MKDKEFYQALSQLSDRDISAELFQELETYLLSSEDARQQYREFFLLQSLTSQEIDVQPYKANVVPMDRIVSRQKVRTLRLAAVSAVAVVLLSFVMMRLFFVPEVVPRNLTFETSPGTEFVLTHDIIHDDQPLGKTLKPGSRLKLSQGVVEFNFPSGVRSVIMAPANVTMRSENELYLDEGLAWFHVPQEAVGFQVTTPDLDVVDLGTDFGVLSSPDEHDQVHVFEGKVQATALRAGSQPEILVAGDARSVDATGKLVEISVDSEAFLAKMPNTLPHLHWSFDEDFTVSGTHPSARKVVSTAAGDVTLVDGPIGKALSLESNGESLKTDWPGLSGGRARSVAFWIKLPLTGQPDGFGGVVGWGDNSQGGGKWELLAHQNEAGMGRLALHWGTSSVSTEFLIEPEQWCHVVVTDAGTLDSQGVPEVNFYFNTQHEYPTRPARLQNAAKTETTTSDAEPLTIGASIRQEALQNRRRFLSAEIDELYIFDGALSYDQAKRFSSRQLSRSEKN